MDSAQATIFDATLTSAVIALFDAYDVELRPTKTAQQGGRDADAGELAGIIGFTSEQMRGTIAIASSPDTIGSMGQTQGSDPGPVRDWMGELANQLLGRVKNRFLKYGVVVNISTPVVVSGLKLQLRDGASGARLYEFEEDAGPVRVFLDVRIGSDVVFEDVNTDDAAEEGDMLLF